MTGETIRHIGGKIERLERDLRGTLTELFKNYSGKERIHLLRRPYTLRDGKQIDGDSLDYSLCEGAIIEERTCVGSWKTWHTEFTLEGYVSFVASLSIEEMLNIAKRLENQF